HRARRLRSVWTRRGHVMRIVRISVTDELRVDVRAAGTGPLILLEHEYGASFAHDEAVAIAIEGPGGTLRIVVAGGHRANDRECTEGEWRQWRLGRAAEHDVGVAIANFPESVADGDRA